MVDSGVAIALGVVGLLVAVLAIAWAVRCAVARRRTEEAKQAVGVGAGLLDKEAVVVDVEAKREEPPLCAICKGPLAAGGGRCRRLRACGHVYHAECVDLWLQRKPICPLCRAGVVLSRTDIVDAIV
ncbi:RING-H2 finger protein ATL56-like [Triticum dicoccoides]|uniref:RING-H2 finger protein ATL56-like n=1 Tax=Triticum dicoccoides TaxID=85692 RepID=UPI000E7A60EB|nr:RING-H2 finger protein ATL56-like [Triticum dicoccoides]